MSNEFPMTRRTDRFARKGIRQTLYTILAVVLCFAGPTYLVALASNVIPQSYAVILGFACFLVGVVLVLKLVKD